MKEKPSQTFSGIIRKRNGITLVALIITVIILLILAGVTIASLSNSGLFEKTQRATKEYEKKAQEDALSLARTEINMKKYMSGENTSKDRSDEIESIMEKAGQETIVVKSGKGADVYLVTFEDTDDVYQFNISTGEMTYIGKADSDEVTVVVQEDTIASISEEVVERQERSGGTTDLSSQIESKLEAKGQEVTVTQDDDYTNKYIITYDNTRDVYELDAETGKTTYIGRYDALDDNIELVQSDIEFKSTPTSWTNGNVSTTIKVGKIEDSENFTIQYSKNGTSYSNYTGAIPSTKNETIFARVKHKTTREIKAYQSTTITNIDKTNPNAPTLTPSGTKSGNNYTTNVVVKITANGDSVGEVDHIEYTMTGAQTGSSNNFSIGSTVTINTLGTSTITAYVVDKAGNRSSAGSLTVTKILLYTVSYNGNGATSGSTANSSHTYGTAKNLTTNGYARVGYDFLGWSTDSTAKTATYSNSQSVSNLSSTNGATVELFAVWKSKAGWINEIVLGGGDVNVLSANYSTLPNEIWVDGVKQSSNSQTIANLSSGEHQVALNYVGTNFEDMHSMFQDCRNIKDIEMSGLDSSSVMDMVRMFYGCSSLERLDLYGLDMSGVLFMNAMFYSCTSLGTLIFPNSGASSVDGANAIFSGCTAELQIPAQYETMYSQALVNAIKNYTGTKTTY